MAHQVKVPVEVSFVPLGEALENPFDLFVTSDFGKVDDQPQLHLAFKVNTSKIKHFDWLKMVMLLGTSNPIALLQHGIVMLLKNLFIIAQMCPTAPQSPI